MKKFFMWVGGIFTLAVILIVATIFIYGTFWGKPLDESSKKFVDESISAITSEWSPQELKNRASPALIATIDKDPESLNKLFSRFSRLGGLKHYSGSTGQSFGMFNIIGPSSITADYVANVEFENGNAVISVKLVRQDKNWKINYFYVNSPAMLN